MPNPKSAPGLRIRSGTQRDMPALVSLIRGLAKYERLSRHCRADLRRLRRDGFGRHRYFETLVCTSAGRTIGFAVYYFAYSTFASAPVLFIEDLFVESSARGGGAGTALMKALAQVAVRKRCGLQRLQPLHAAGLEARLLKTNLDHVSAAVHRRA